MKKIRKFFESLGRNKGNDAIQSVELERETDRKLELGRLIGYGNFNFVCIGFVKSEDDFSDAPYQPVAVKIPREDVAIQMDMDNELSIMKKLGSHDFILSVIGKIESSKIDNCSFCGTFLLTSLCSNGSLKDYLKRLSKCDKNEELQSTLLLDDAARALESGKFCYQIACGMEYIASKKLCHRDLSARNVLLDDRKNCKISDFGLSNWLMLVEYGEGSRSMVGIPWRWLAPECFNGSGWSATSDVWSFGVTMWEIFSMGDTPFPELRWGADFQDGIRDGSIRLSLPAIADQDIYDLMKNCWHTEPQSRPTFSTLVKALQARYVTFQNQFGPQFVTSIEDAQPSKIPVERPIYSAEGGLVAGQYGPEIPLKEFRFDTPTPWTEAYGNHDFATAIVAGQRVHVKAMRQHYVNNISNNRMKGIIRELKILRDIGPHPNIIELVGAFTTEISKGFLYIATEYCEKGLLTEFLKANQNQLRKNGDQSCRKCARFSAEIAAALGYVNGKNIVYNGKGIHSVVVDAYETCKLRDFYFSKYLSGLPHTSTKGGPLPPKRWTAPEVSKFGYTKMTDVWGFGITLWEIYNLAGNVPAVWNPKSKIRVDLTSPPELASQTVYEKILECCNKDESMRPTFQELHSFFQNQSAGDYYTELV